MNIDTLIVFAGIVFLIAIVPGPNALLVLFTALTRSRTLAFSNILGVCSGFMVHAFISAQGLSLLLSQSSWAFFNAQICRGGLSDLFRDKQYQSRLNHSDSSDVTHR